MSDKFERIKSLKDRLIGMVEGQVNGNIADVDAKELGEVVDMIKDLSEVIYYCSVTDAMEESSNEEKKYYMDKYDPNTRYYTNGYGSGMRNYTDIYSVGNDVPPRYYDGYSNAERTRDMDRSNSRMYYTEPKNMWIDSVNHRDYREGKAPVSRRMYMEMKDTKTKDESMKDLEKYIHDMGDDLFEIVQNLDANERAIVKTKISNLATKIV